MIPRMREREEQTDRQAYTEGETEIEIEIYKETESGRACMCVVYDNGNSSLYLIRPVVILLRSYLPGHKCTMLMYRFL